ALGWRGKRTTNGTTNECTAAPTAAQPLEDPAMSAPPLPLYNPALREQIAPEEWQARVELAACYRLVAHFGWDDLIATHISMRVPGPEEHFLLNPFGLMFHEITASCLVKVDLEGNLMSESPYRINKAG